MYDFVFACIFLCFFFIMFNAFERAKQKCFSDFDYEDEGLPKETHMNTLLISFSLLLLLLLVSVLLVLLKTNLPSYELLS